MFCTKCGANNTDGMQFCASCGTPLIQTDAGEQGQSYYQNGAPAAGSQPQYQQPPYGQPQYGNTHVDAFGRPVKAINKVAYILLTWFFGWLGVHRFLRGQVGIGILYILTIGGLGIAVLVDFIISLTKLTNYTGVDNYEFTIVPRGNWTR